jgi:hypothetical protein
MKKPGQMGESTVTYAGRVIATWGKRVKTKENFHALL